MNSVKMPNFDASITPAAISVSHPEYEPQTKTIQQTVEITTEKRDMAVTLNLVPLNPNGIVGDNQRFTASVDGAPVDSTTTYVWEVNGEVQASAVNILDYTAPKAGSYTIKVTSTTKADGADDEVHSQETTLTVANKTMTVTVAVTAASNSITFGESYSASAEVSGAPEGSTFEYLWNTGETTKEISKTPTSVGEVKLSCKVTAKATDYDDAVADSNEVTITVNKADMSGISVLVSGNPTTIKVGETTTFTAAVSGQPTGSAIAYSWNSGGTSSTEVVKGPEEGKLEATVDVSISNPNYNDFTTSASNSVTVEKNDPEVPDECPFIYVHPLPHRESAYIWCGWWVMDAIEKLTDEGKDWKTATKEDSKYYCHLNVLAKMLVDFPEVDVQESRNGRIVHKSALDAGIIY
ncbi:head outer capsid protein [Serratia phage 4S]|nr:head outer capsid protein [Serratia phage 4S]